MLEGGAEEGVRWDESLEEVISGNCHLPALIIHWEIAFSLVLQKYNNSNKHLPKEQQLGFAKHTLPGASGRWLRPSESLVPVAASLACHKHCLSGGGPRAPRQSLALMRLNLAACFLFLQGCK